jgi:lycopene cyclase domain-containing protein
MSTYLTINALVIVVPLLLSFDRRVQFYKSWLSVWTAIVAVGAFFIAWDVAFTEMGIWGFNPLHIGTTELFGLPIEEMLFFVTVPYACLFLHYTYTTYVSFKLTEQTTNRITLILSIFLLGVFAFGATNWYTGTAMLYMLLTLLVVHFTKQRKVLQVFYITYAFMLVPFLITNGILTGSWIEQEVVWYNDAENLGIRLGTIPVEDTFYGMSLVLSVLALQDWLHQSVFKKK